MVFSGLNVLSELCKCIPLPFILRGTFVMSRDDESSILDNIFLCAKSFCNYIRVVEGICIIVFIEILAGVSPKLLKKFREESGSSCFRHKTIPGWHDRRLARSGGAKRIFGLIYEETHGVLEVFLENVVREAVTYTEHAKRKTVAVMDVVYALKRQGKTLNGRSGAGVYPAD